MANKNIPYVVERLPFTTIELEGGIDYFKIPVDVLTKNGFDVTMNSIPLANNEWLSIEKHLQTIDHNKRETVVLNIQVGKGKTHACYDLIKKYADEGYIIVVCSPYKKLVNKDCENLIKRGLDPFNYNNVDDIMAYKVDSGYHDYPSDYNIHVMTINCLLQNPGDDAFDQKKHKRDYLKDILFGCYDKFKITKKIIFFFDEIHDSIHNFKSKFLANYVDWHRVIHKAYVSSATFTPASIPVIQYISSITDGKISIYETPRLKIDVPVSLHLHITERTYSGENLFPLIHLKRIIQSNRGKNINILTGHKAMANGLYDAKNNDAEEIVTAIQSLKPNLITGDDENPFDLRRNNLGTTFKTGVDIKDSDSVFIVILPCIYSNNADYGIFRDGIPSLIQSLARVRKIGQVHIFMLEPNVIINLESSKTLLPYFDYTTKEPKDYEPQNSIYLSLIKSHNRILKRAKGANLKIKSLQKDLNLGYSPHTETDNLIEDSTNQLVKNNYSYGKELSTYILWAALNNQISNATLKEITYTSIRKKKVNINKDDAVNIIYELIDKEVIVEACKHNLIDAIEFILKMIEHSNSDGEVAKNVFIYKNKKHSIAGLKTQVFFMQELVNVYVSAYSEGIVTNLSKNDYILACSLQSQDILIDESGDTNLDRILKFSRLNEYRKQFIAMLEEKIVTNKKGERIIHRDTFKYIPDPLVDRITSIVQSLNSVDSFIALKIFPFMPKLIGKDDINQKKEDIYKEFEKCFTNVTGKNRTLPGEKDMYYLIDGELERTLPDEILSLKLL